MESKQLVALVTGRGQGIGKCITHRFLEHGRRVVIVEIDEEAGRETLNEYSTLGEIEFIHCDVADDASVKNAVKATVTRFGGLDILINNAAIGISKPVEALTPAEWRRVIGVNLTGAFLAAHYGVPHLRKAGGSIINIASTRAFMSEPDTEAYSASKGGIHALTHALAISLGPEVRVNCISPGWIEVGEWKKKSSRHAPDHTPEDKSQHPSGRVGTPDDIASLALFLTDSANSFITGANFMVDGGMTRKMIYV